MIRDHVRYVPAGLEQWTTRTQVFVKNRRNAYEDQGIKRHNSAYFEIALPDRTLYITTSGLKNKVLLDKEIDADYMVPISNPAELLSRIDLVLINPFHATQGFSGSNPFKPLGVKVISDSGGFQMLRGTSDFVDPDTVIDFYNKNADIGMPLDLPLPTTAESGFFDAVSRMMVANDKYMIPRLDPKIKLAVVSHGSCIESRKRRLDVVWRPTPVVAIAGLNTLQEGSSTHKTLTALANAMYVISQTRQDARYYHFLGVTSRFWFLIYALLVGTGYVKSCGGDSVSHRLSAISGDYRYGLGYDGGVRDTLLRETHNSVSAYCPCPVCGSIHDLRLLAKANWMESHMIWFSEQGKDQICDSIQAYLAGRLSLNAICKQWLGSAKYDLLAKSVNYVESVVQKGFHTKVLPSQKQFLFGAPKGAELSDKATEHFTQIIRRYEQFHKKRFLK